MSLDFYCKRRLKPVPVARYMEDFVGSDLRDHDA
jgi:hypothetical protein